MVVNLKASRAIINVGVSIPVWQELEVKYFGFGAKAVSPFAISGSLEGSS